MSEAIKGKPVLFKNNCPIREETGDGRPCGRCFTYLDADGKCPRHGDVSAAVRHYVETGKLTSEREHRCG